MTVEEEQVDVGLDDRAQYVIIGYRLAVEEAARYRAAWVSARLRAARQKITDHTTDAPVLAKLFHETYERLAPDHGYKTREASAVPWEDVPAANKALMTAVCAEVLTAMQARDAALVQQGRNEVAAGTLRVADEWFDTMRGDAKFEGVARGMRVELRAAVAAAGASDLAAIRAEAWDEGQRAGASRVRRQWSDEPNCPDAVNPYRVAAEAGER